MVTNNLIYKNYILSLILHIIFFVMLFVPHNQKNSIFKKKNTLNININYLNKEEYIPSKISSDTTENKRKIQNKTIIKEEKVLKKISPQINKVKSRPKSDKQPAQLKDKTKESKKKVPLSESLVNNINQPSKIRDKVEKNKIKDKNKIIVNEKSNILASDKVDITLFKEYNNYLKQIIQIEASKNYPKISIKKKEQGTVELIFSLNSNGFLKEIKIGEKTDASQRLINSAKKTIEKISPFRKNTILKTNGIFSIVIIYKLN